MKKLLLFALSIQLFSFDVFAQDGVYNNSIVISPGSIFLGRLNTRYERISESNFTYGGRVEASFIGLLDRHVWMIPYGRFYFFNKEQNGLYAEGGIGFRLRYQKTWLNSEDYDPTVGDIFKSSAVGRMYLGTQWFTGKKSKTPFDIGLGLNIDLQNRNVPEGVNIGTLLVGPMSVFSFRIQTGFCW